jgi:uncharacterized protein YcsI (UPF0317 family)
MAASALFTTPADLRAAVRRGEFTGQTAGQCPGYVQTNVVILPRTYAEEFADFCRANPKPCPLVARTEPGRFDFACSAFPVAGGPGFPEAGGPGPSVAAGCDLRTDVPRYRVFRSGVAESLEPTEIRGLWQDDFVGFLIGCSFTFETALVAAGLPVRHIDERRNVPMFRTTLPCAAAGRFSGPLVVSMRPYRPEQVARVIEVTGRYPTMHGGPIHVGDPAAIGIRDIRRPDFGDGVTVRDDEVPVFWACGVTPQLALAAAAPEIALTHSPGCMFVTDLRNEQFERATASGG